MQLRKVCTHVYQTRVSTVNAILTNFEWKWMEMNHENMMQTLISTIIKSFGGINEK